MPQTRAEMEPQAAVLRILVVEDEPFIRFAMAEALREKGVSVVEAASADEAWQYLTAGGSVDLVFTDHRMPGSMSGAQLAARIKTQYRIAVIVTSAFFKVWVAIMPPASGIQLSIRITSGVIADTFSVILLQSVKVCTSQPCSSKT